MLRVDEDIDLARQRGEARCYACRRARGLEQFSESQLDKAWPVKPRICISVCAARTLNAAGQPRITLSLR